MAVRQVDLEDPIGYVVRVADPGKLQEQLSDDALRVGEADLVVSVFDVPDTNPAVGNMGNVEVIDRGAFLPLISRLGDEGSRPLLLDHGDVHVRGYVDSFKVAGKVTKFAEMSDGLQTRGLYNLRTEAGKTAFEQLDFDQQTPGDTVRFSFRNPIGEEKYRGGDGFTHIKAFPDIREVSQLPFPSQVLTHARRGSLVARGEGDETTLPDIEALRGALGDQDFAEAVLATLLEQAPDIARHAWSASNVPTPPSSSVIKIWLRDGAFRDEITKFFQEDEIGRKVFQDLIYRSEALDPVAAFWQHTFGGEVKTYTPDEEVSRWYETIETERLRAAVDESGWDGNRAMGMCNSASDYSSICAGVRTVGEPGERQHYALPHHYLGKPANRAGVSAALGRIGQTQNLANRSAAQSHLDAHSNSFPEK